MYRLKCPECKIALRTASEPAGLKVRCPKCRHIWIVPELPDDLDDDPSTQVAETVGPSESPTVSSPTVSSPTVSSAMVNSPPSEPTPTGSPKPPSPSASGSVPLVAPGTELGVFELGRLLGRGAFGEVYEATDTLLQRPVAVKVLNAEVAADREMMSRFLSEARAAAAVRHPNLVTIYQVGREGTTTYIAMELVRGTDCQKWLRSKGPMPEGMASHVISEAARGLAAAHARGIVHRDVKPANLIIDDGGRVKVTDFGLALRAAPGSRPPTGPVKVSTEGEVAGTPNYMSPEQCRGESLDARSDLYSLAATYFALLTGRTPFQSRHTEALMLLHCEAPIPDPRSLRPELPVGCSRVIFRAMAKLPTERYPTAEAMIADLGAIGFR